MDWPASFSGRGYERDVSIVLMPLASLVPEDVTLHKTSTQAIYIMTIQSTNMAGSSIRHCCLHQQPAAADLYCQSP